MNNVFSRLYPYNQKNHIEWVDVAKGLGVLLVFCGHLLYKSSIPEINIAIYSFHTGFFFILSGFVFRKPKSGFLPFLKDKMLRLLLPIFFFMFAGTMVARFVYKVENPDELLKLFFYYDGKFVYNMPVWFFISLFEIYIVAYFLNIPNSQTTVKGALAILFLFIGYLIYRQEQYVDAVTGKQNYIILFGIDKTIISLGFFVLGSFFKDIYDITPAKIRILLLNKSILFLSIMLMTLGVMLNSKVSLYDMRLHNCWHFYISCICGSLLTIAISILLSKLKLVSFILQQWSNNSIFIIGTHYILKIGFVTLFINATEQYWGQWQFDIIVPFYAIAVLTAYSLVCPLVIDQLLPFITGKKSYLYSKLLSRAKKVISNN